jgi:chromate transporter
MTLARLAMVFGILSLLGFGGGNAIIPQMHHDVVEHYHWITSAQFTRYYALGKLAPGSTTSMSALVGYAVAELPGAIVAVLAVFVPAAVVVHVAGTWWHALSGHPWRNRLGRAIRPVVLGLIWAGVATLARGTAHSLMSILLIGGATLLLLFTRWNQSLFVLAGGAIGALSAVLAR